MFLDISLKRLVILNKIQTHDEPVATGIEEAF
jgi:hypothetical protein